MKANYHTAMANPQTAVKFPPRAVRASMLSAPARPRLTGNREVLRALRAAEMALWETVPPSTVPQPQTNAHKSVRQLVRTHSKGGLDRETLLIFVLAASGLLGLLGVLHDIAGLLAGCSQWLASIRSLLT
jgi:hypothetical protein